MQRAQSIRAGTAIVLALSLCAPPAAAHIVAPSVIRVPVGGESCAFPALSTVLLASDDKTLGAPADTDARGTASERGVPALFSWADFDGDGRLDLAAVSGEGALQLLANAGDGRFEDVTERLGLSGVENAAFPLWGDYDADGRIDLFVGARAGKSRLFRNEDGSFIDISAGSGFSSEGAVLSAHWLDHDGDERLDLHVVTAERNELFRGLEGGWFERAELPLAGTVGPPDRSGSLSTDRVSAAGEDADELEAPAAPESPNEDDGGKRAAGARIGTVSLDELNVPGDRVPSGPTPGGVTPLGPFPLGKADSLRDQANPGGCIQASSNPTLGMLYPMSQNFFVDANGNVGIGTTTPATKFHVVGGTIVAGDAAVTGTLTLNPLNDRALDFVGSIYKDALLFGHTRGGGGNTGFGREALRAVTTGTRNTGVGSESLWRATTACDITAIGFRASYYSDVSKRTTATGSQALYFNTANDNTANGALVLFNNTTGTRNTGGGAYALYGNTLGDDNTGFGFRVLRNTTTGNGNTAGGSYALTNNTIGYANTGVGFRVLFSNTTGDRNTGFGSYALFNNTTGDRNTGFGKLTLLFNTSGFDNTGGGYGALDSVTTGDRNIGLGAFAGGNLTTGNDNIDIGHTGVASDTNTVRIGTPGIQTRTFVAGIRGVTTGIANAIAVVVDSAGQLGTLSSSRRFKKEIADMGELTERLFELRPVVFRYKEEQQVESGEVPLEYGLIAEEVAEILPDLVVYDEEGEPFTVKYHLLSSMLLNELKKERARSQAQDSSHWRELDELRNRLAALEARISGGKPPDTIAFR